MRLALTLFWCLDLPREVALTTNSCLLMLLLAALLKRLLASALVEKLNEISITL